MEKYKLKMVQTEVKLHAVEGRQIAVNIRASSEKERWWLWQDKRSVGVKARYAQLAYAYLRGVPYEVLERRCRNLPFADRISDLIESYGFACEAAIIMGWINGSAQPVGIAAE